MFNNNVVQFQIKGIDMIGNINNGSVIGLSTDGKAFLEELICNENSITDEILTEEQQILYNTLQEQGYFKDEEVVGHNAEQRNRG